jgi:hypothetical protein
MSRRVRINAGEAVTRDMTLLHRLASQRQEQSLDAAKRL